MKPLELNYKRGVILSFLILLLALFGVVEKGKNIVKLLNPNDNLLNWRFVITLLVIVCLLTWFVMNKFWMKDHQELQKTNFEKENLKLKLKLLESERLTDIITGIPNSRALEKDLEFHLEEKRKNVKLQFIFIDLKGFKKINDSYGFLKANNLLRRISQTIYQKMRRNEEMYKYPINPDSEQKIKKTFYRVHTGGDEFAFIIEGDQPDAIGFANRLVGQFNVLSKDTNEILGKLEKLSFHCAITEINARDTFEDILGKGKECYRLAKEGKGDFNICWHPNNIEAKQELNTREIADYNTAYKLFDVMTMKD